MAAPELMLASPTPTTLRRDTAAETLTRDGNWGAELKLDGIRACATIEGTSVRLTNKRGVDITHRYPEIVAKLSSLGLRAVLDGEIVVLDRRGRPDFAAVHRRDAQEKTRSAILLSQATPARFVAFDVLEIAGMDVRSLTYESRRGRLDHLSPGLDVNPWSTNGEQIWNWAISHDLEGVVLKRLDSRYIGGQRSTAWVKVKRLKTISAMVCGLDPGKGHRAATFGALHLAVLGESQELVEIGSVGSGFSNQDCITIRRLIDENRHPIIVEVEFMELAPSGQLRQPVFKGLRTDVDPAECTYAQLKAESTD